MQLTLYLLMLKKISKEYKRYKIVEHWQPANEILLVRDLTNPKNKFGLILMNLDKCRHV